MAVDIDSLQIEIEATSGDAASKIEQLATALTNLKSAAKGGAGLTTTTKQLQALSNAAKLINGTNLDSQKIQQFASAMNSLSTIQKASGLNSTINALKKLPEISTALDKADLGKFAQQMNQVASAMRPLATEMQKVANGFSAFPIRIQKIIQSNSALTASNNKTAKSFGVLGTGISSAQAKFGVYLIAFRQIASVMSNWVKESNDYVENLNLFTVAMGDYAEEAKAYAEEIQAAMGIDPSEWMRNQGVFMQMASGFGVATDSAALMSKNLTQLGYDISSFYNIGIEEAMEKLQSGLAGEIEPLRRLGYAIDVASLEQVALNHGITESVNAMSQAEKSQLRYIAIMEQSTNAMGDLSRTIQTPANAMRILNQQITQLSRALGNLLIPLLQKIIPWVQAFVEVITEAIQALAVLFGFELPTIDYSGLEGVSAGASEAEDAIGGATDAAKEMKRELLGIDELTILEPNAASGSGVGVGGSGGDLGLELPEYNFLNGLTSQTNELKSVLEDILYNYVIPIGTAFAAWKIATGLLTGIEKLTALLAGLKGASLVFDIGFKAVGLSAFLADLNEFMRYLEDFRKNGPTFQNVVGMISQFVGMIGDALILLGNLKVGGALKVLQGIGEIIVAIKDISENGINWSNALTAVRGLTNIAIGVGAFTGNIKLAGAAISVQGFTVIIREIAENWDAIRQGDWSGVDKATLIVGAIEILGGIVVALDVFSRLKGLSSVGKATTAMTTVSNTIGTLSTTVGTKLSPNLTSLAKNLGIAVGIIAEISAAAIIIVGAIAVLGIELEQVGKAWEPVINNGETVVTSIFFGVDILAGVGLATYGLGTIGGTAVVNIGIGAVVLAEIGVAAGLFVIEIWAIGKLLDQVGQAWQPVLDNGEEIATAIGVGTGILAGVAVVTAAIGAVTIGTAGTIALAIGIGAGVLAEIALACIGLAESLSSVADKLTDRVAPSLERLNDKLPDLESDMADFTDYMTGLSDEISSYTDSMGSITWSSIVNGFQKLFAGDPISNLADDVENIYNDTVTLNEKLELANPELEKAIELLTDYNSFMSDLKLLTEEGGEIQLAKDMFVNLKEVGKQLVTGLSEGIDETAHLASKSMNDMGISMINSLNSSLESNKYKVRNSLANLFTGVNIKLPHFSITGSFNLEAKQVPKVNVSWYANGGFPDYGEMFIAREDGPELVGRIGNRTAVANNDQIVQGIASANDGVINAIYAMAQRIVTAIEENGGDIYVEADGTATQNRRNRMYGKTLQYI